MKDNIKLRGGVNLNQQLDTIGKLPLALQQLGLALMRADEAGDSKLSKKIRGKMDEMLSEINVQ